jgi:PncC family amidohydrolase
MSTPSHRGHTPRSTETLHDIASDVIRLLLSANQTLGVAESLTSGQIMSTLTSIPGSSATFRGGIVTYATPLKHSLLNVDPDLIAREGVIHPDVASQMADGARRATTPAGEEVTGWGIGTTGVAGPDEQDGKPVGTVYIGIASPRGGGKAWGPFMFPGSRERVREATVMEALARLREELAAAAGEEQGKGE